MATIHDTSSRTRIEQPRDQKRQTASTPARTRRRWNSASPNAAGQRPRPLHEQVQVALDGVADGAVALERRPRRPRRRDRRPSPSPSTRAIEASPSPSAMRVRRPAARAARRTRPRGRRSARWCLTAWKLPIGTPNCCAFLHVLDGDVEHAATEPDELRRGPEGGPVEALVRRREALVAAEQEVVGDGLPVHAGTGLGRRRPTRPARDRPATARPGAPRPARASRKRDRRVAAVGIESATTRSRTAIVADPRRRCQLASAGVRRGPRRASDPRRHADAPRPPSRHRVGQTGAARLDQQRDEVLVGHAQPAWRSGTSSPRTPISARASHAHADTAVAVAARRAFDERRPTAPPHAVRTASGGHWSGRAARADGVAELDLVVGQGESHVSAVLPRAGRAHARRRCCAGSRWCRRRSGPDRANS